VPVLEKNSGLVFNVDFYCGYSPERVNPGDKLHTVATIKKITSGSTPEVAEKVDKVYAAVITAGTFKTTSIKIAEAAKVVENSQRDINIAFVNELAKIFNLMNIDTHQVLEASATKWNFMPFKPGLVGGHCISVDPYYLVKKAKDLGYNSEIISAGRLLNDGMSDYIANEVKKLILQKGIAIERATVLLLGITFKENCPDIRNSRVVDMIKKFESFGMRVSVFDPWANSKEVRSEYGVELIKKLPEDFQYDSIVLAVAHREFQDINWRKYVKDNGIIYDVKGLLDTKMINVRL
jgi:UDP-N-acetyl-D-galactosamine dehydrogenase